jgi:class 3 adenylate cyclase/tetratricopeptide (TPR) repeat protein
VPQERKLATILFADIVGSTALVRDHDAEVARRTLQRTYDGIRGVLAEHGGTVEKFIGDAVMAVFGVPIAHDDDAERAVRAAFALRDLIGRREPEAFAFALRIGINTGEVVADAGGSEHLATGQAVVAAARLEQAATPDTILVGALTRRLTESAVRYAAARSIEAKGLGSIEAYQAEDLLGAIPGPSRGVPGLVAPLIGRDAEMRVIAASYARAGEERRAQLLTVLGAPGVGKSRLAAEFASTLAGRVVRWGRCLPYGRGITFWPVREILRSDIGVGPDDPYDVAIHQLRAAVVAITDEPSTEADAILDRLAVLTDIAKTEDALPDVEPSAIAQELAWGLRRYLEARARSEPLALIFEDIHWADAALLDLIEELAEWATAPILILCLARPELLDARPGWGGTRNAASIELRPLSSEETRELVGRLLEVEALPEPLRHGLIERTEGNPLYVEEFVRLLIDSGVIERRDHAWIATDEAQRLNVPPTLQGLIAARLDRAPAKVKRLLQQAAVVGRVFWTRALASFVDLSEAEIDELLLDAAGRDLARPVDEAALGGGRSFSFKHILTRDVAYAALPKEERSRLHDRVGRWFEQMGAAAEYGDLAAHHAEQAFLLAREVHTVTDELGGRAFHLLLDASRDTTRADLSAQLAFAERALAIGEAAGVSREDEAELALRIARRRHSIIGGPTSVVALDRAIEHARLVNPSKEFVWTLDVRAELALNVDDLNLAERLIEEALAAARQLDDPEALVDAILGAGLTAARFTGEWEPQRWRFEEALTLAKARGTGRDAANALGGLRIVALQSGDATQMCALDQEIGSLLSATSALDALRTLNFAANSAWIIGDYGQAVRCCEELRRRSKELGRRGMFAWASLELGTALHELGELERAVAVLQEASTHYTRATERMPVEVDSELARAYVGLGRIEDATHLLDSLAVSRSPFFMASTAGVRAELAQASARYDDAERLYLESVKLLAPHGWGWKTAILRVRAARYLVAYGRLAQARPLLESARAFYRDPLMWRRRDEVESLLRNCKTVGSTA